MIEITKPGPQISERDIERIERTLSIKFPSDYRVFLLKTNGGIACGSFDCLDGEHSCVGSFYPIDANDDQDILKANEARKSRLPKDFVAIANDYGGGDEICIDCTPGETFGNVYFWDHEMEADPSQGMTPETAGNIHLIAPSFTKFLECLYEVQMPETPPELRGELTTPPENEGVYEAMLRRKGLLRD